MRSHAVAAATLALVTPLVILTGASSAQAASETVTGKPNSVCANNAGGSSNSVMLSNSSEHNGYECAYTSQSDKKGLDAGHTKSWTVNSPQGYLIEKTCKGADSSKVQLTTASASTKGGSSYTVTATNWGTNKHHFGAAVLWSTAGLDNTSIKSSQYSPDCGNGKGEMNAAKLWPVKMQMVGNNTGVIGDPSTFQISVDGGAYDGPTPATGEVALMVMAGSKPNPSQDLPLGAAYLNNGAAAISTPFYYKNSEGSTQPLSPGTYRIYGVYAGTGSTSAPVVPSKGWTPQTTDAISVTISAPGASSQAGATDRRVMRVSPQVIAPAATPAPFSGPAGTTIIEESTSTAKRISLTCPTGGVPTQINVLSTDGNVGNDDVHLISSGRGGAWLDNPPGTTTAMQLVCRKDAAKVERLGKVTYGSALADSIAVKQGKTSTVFAGLGADTVVIKATEAVADGGVGSDTITVKAKDGVAYGSFGPDTLRATTAERTLLIGGPGPDTFYGGPGRTHINARDGRPGDVINCASNKNVVYADKGDIIKGPCKVK